MEVGQGQNWGCNAKGRKIKIIFKIINYKQKCRYRAQDYATNTDKQNDFSQMERQAITRFHEDF
jgi:hypothetical protein